MSRRPWRSPHSTSPAWLARDRTKAAGRKTQSDEAERGGGGRPPAISQVPNLVVMLGESAVRIGGRMSSAAFFRLDRVTERSDDEKFP